MRNSAAINHGAGNTLHHCRGYRYPGIPHGFLWPAGNGNPAHPDRRPKAASRSSIPGIPPGLHPLGTSASGISPRQSQRLVHLLGDVFFDKRGYQSCHRAGKRSRNDSCAHQGHNHCHQSCKCLEQTPAGSKQAKAYQNHYNDRSIITGVVIFAYLSNANVL